MAETTAVEKVEPKAQLTIGRACGGLVPRNVEELWRFAQMVSASNLAPKGMEKPETIAVAITMGLEVGLSPMAALQNIAVINGRPTVWGDAALGIVQASGLLESFAENPIEDDKGNVTGYLCVAKRRGNPEPIVRRFTRDQAKLAGLAGKSGPWSQYPERMMQMRARSWCLRDGFADVLRGLSVREEVQDTIIDTPATVTPDYTPGRQSFRRTPAHEPTPVAEPEAPPTQDSEEPAPEPPPAASPEDKAAFVAAIQKAMAAGNDSVNRAVKKALASADVTELDRLHVQTLADIAAMVE